MPTSSRYPANPARTTSNLAPSSQVLHELVKKVTPDQFPKDESLPPKIQDLARKQDVTGGMYEFYTRSDQSATVDKSGQDASKIDYDHLKQLNNRNYGTGYFEPGYTIVSAFENDCIVEKGSLYLRINRNLHLQASDRYAPKGSQVAIFTPPNQMQPGFYMAIGNAGPGGEGGLLRVYANVTPEGQCALMGALTQDLNKNEIPFAFKATYNRSESQRADNSVLYVDRENYHLVRSILQAFYHDQPHYFHPTTPLFTKILAPGLGLAEEPNFQVLEGESFGLHRCRRVAEGLIQAWNEGKTDPKAQVETILETWISAGIDPMHPYLNPNSTDIYLPL